MQITSRPNLLFVSHISSFILDINIKKSYIMTDLHPTCLLYRGAEQGETNLSFAQLTATNLSSKTKPPDSFVLVYIASLGSMGAVFVAL
jgi:hypothetical protein